RIAPDRGNQIGDLINCLAVARGPRPPLLAIDRTEITMFVRPFVPDPNPVIVEIFDVGIAGQKPEQLVDNGFDVQLLGREQRKALRQVEPRLVAEYRQRTGPGAVVLLHAVGENVLHQVEVLTHGSSCESCKGVYRAPRLREMRPADSRPAGGYRLP